jgi:hypothetical protein
MIRDLKLFMYIVTIDKKYTNSATSCEKFPQKLKIELRRLYPALLNL